MNIKDVFDRLFANVKEVEESKEYIETLMKTVQVFIVVLNKRLRPIYINDHGLRKLKIQKEEIPGLRIGDYVEKKVVKELAGELRHNTNVLNKEVSLFLKDGKRLDADVSVSKMFNTADELIGYISVIADITQRKKAEVNLRNQIAFSRQIFRTIPDMILILDMNLKIIFMNEKAEDFFKISSSDNRNIDKFLSKSSLKNGFDDFLRNVIQAGDDVHQINVLNPFMEADSYVDLVIEPLRSRSGIVGGLILIRDISEWRNLTKKLKSLQEFMGRLIDASPYAIISVDEGYRVSVWNVRAEKFFGVSNDDAVNQNLFEICSIFNRYRDTVNEVQILNKTSYLTEEIIYFDEDQQFIANLYFYPVHSGATSVVINVEDVTEVKKLENSLLQAQKMEALGMMTSGIIHDFNNVLSGILGYASLMYKKIDEDSELKKYVSNIMGSSERASGMVRRILEFSQKRLSKREILDINEVIEESLGFLGLSLRNIRLENKLSAKKIFVDADRTKISQVIINLAINASEAVKDGPEPMITVESDEVWIKKGARLTDGAYARINIADNGGGIKKEHLERIFEPFFTTRPKAKGTGIGLATVKEIVEDYKGNIEVESEIEQGTTFTILLPSVKGPVLESEEKSREEVLASVEGWALLIDDEEVIRMIGADMLNALSIKCMTACNGGEGINLYKENKGNICFVILDIEMPGLPGDKVYDVLKELNPAVRILVTSGYSQEYLETNVFRRKIDYFMAKPFQLNQLSHKLNTLIKG
jgi:PAS domain S-box-containing protein